MNARPEPFRYGKTAQYIVLGSILAFFNLIAFASWQSKGIVWLAAIVGLLDVGVYFILATDDKPKAQKAWQTTKVWFFVGAFALFFKQANFFNNSTWLYWLIGLFALLITEVKVNHLFEGKTAAQTKDIAPMFHKLFFFLVVGFTLACGLGSKEYVNVGHGMAVVFYGFSAVFVVGILLECDEPPIIRNQRESGVFGDAGWATMEEISHTGLMPESFPVPTGFSLGRAIDAYADAFVANYGLAYSGECSMITIAPSGSGKNACAVMPTLLTMRDASVFVTDMKGENWWVTRHCRHNIHKQRVITLNPFNLWRDELGYEPERALTHCCNPLSEINHLSNDFIEQVDNIAAAIVEQPTSTSDGGFFNKKARELVACVIAYVCHDQEERDKGNTHLPRVRDIIASNEENFIAWAIKAERSEIPRIRNVAAEFSKPSKETRIIRSTAGQFLGWLDNEKIRYFLTDSHFNFADMKREKVTVYAMFPADMPDTYRPLLRLLIQAFFNAMKAGGTAKAGDIPVVAILDEANQLGQMKTLEDAPSIMRGYGCRVWNIFQNLGQLKSCFGENWEGVLANSEIIQIFTPNDMTTAEYFSKKIGNKTVIVKSHNMSHGQRPYGQYGGGTTNEGTSEGPSAVPFLAPPDLMALDKNAAIVFRAGLKYPVLTTRWPYFSAAEQQVLWNAGYDYYPLPHIAGHNHPSYPPDIMEYSKAIASRWVSSWADGNPYGNYWNGDAIP